MLTIHMLVRIHASISCKQKRTKVQLTRINAVDKLSRTVLTQPFWPRLGGAIGPSPYAEPVTVSDPAAQQQTSPETAATTASRARTAAFFDLDKTIIAKSSTLAFSKPFFDQG